MIADLDLLELELRQLTGVSGVAFDDSDDAAMIVQLLLSDPENASTAAEKARELASRRLDVPTNVVVRPAGAPLAPPAFEAAIGRLPGVRSCTAERGSRGEVRKIAVAVEDADVLASVRGEIAVALGGALPDDRLAVEVLSSAD